MGKLIDCCLYQENLNEHRKGKGKRERKKKKEKGKRKESFYLKDDTALPGSLKKNN